ncbi:hypothetical protein SBDP1_470050 [Syntrophobacter sp. SbD1]|nr:hypothetical protein SBDP1_470050 [Syntrophobacter sp. SbD1]
MLGYFDCPLGDRPAAGLQTLDLPT